MISGRARRPRRGGRRTGRLRRTDRRPSASPVCDVQTALDATCSGARQRPITLRKRRQRATADRVSSSRSASCAGAISVSQECSLICCSSTSLVERMVQRQRSARQQPDHQRGGEAGERARCERRHHGRALRHVAFQRQREAAGDQAQMRARHGAEAVRRHVERDHRRLAAVLDHGARGGGLTRQ